ncbi:MAG: hypothetical protein BGP11_00685 [Rhodobacterales bacterium 65-51]|nr:MAG: hypothetical protein BGP11_00685 [Rhodobacterales bacterium 65-51]
MVAGRDKRAKIMQATPPGQKLQALLGGGAFILLLAGTNTPTPLLPVYREVLGFSPLTMTLTYISYVGALVAVLFVAASPAIASRAPLMLVLSLGLACAADLLLGTGQAPGILAGRALQGLSGGLGTGAAAAVVVAAIGAGGRALSATGNLAGAILGTSASELVLQLTGTRAITLSFHIHALACIALSLPLALLLMRRRALNQQSIHTGTANLDPVSPILRANWRPLLTGCLTWSALSSAIVFLPSYFADHGMPLVQALGIPLLLLASLIVQLASPRMARLWPQLSGLLSIALGLAAILIAAATGQDLPGLAGFVLIGAGAGGAYRLSLILLTQGTGAATQGRLASLYAAITYGVTASVVLLAGAVAQRAGLVPVTTLLLAVTLLGCLAALPLAPRLGRSGP